MSRNRSWGRATSLLALAVVGACAASGGRPETATVTVAPSTSGGPVDPAQSSSADEPSEPRPTPDDEPEPPRAFAEAQPDGSWLLQPRGWKMSAASHLPFGAAHGDATGVRCGEGACKLSELCCNDNDVPFCLPSVGKLGGIAGIERASVACAAAVEPTYRGFVARARGCDDTSQCGRGERCCSIVRAAMDNYFCNDARGRRDCFGREPCARGRSCPSAAPVCGDGFCRTKRPSDQRGVACGAETCAGATPRCCAAAEGEKRRCAAACAEGETTMGCTSIGDCARPEFCAVDPLGNTDCSDGAVWGDAFLGSLCREDADCDRWSQNQRASIRASAPFAQVKLGKARCVARKPFGMCDREEAPLSIRARCPGDCRPPTVGAHLTRAFTMARSCSTSNGLATRIRTPDVFNTTSSFSATRPLTNTTRSASSGAMPTRASWNATPSISGISRSQRMRSKRSPRPIRSSAARAPVTATTS